MTGKYRFYKTPEQKWFIDIPEWTKDIEELQMVLGADTMLDVASGNTNECFLKLSDAPFEGAEEARLIENLQGSIGGGNYLMATFRGESVNQEMWLCEVTEYVFGYLPSSIYVEVTSD
ncbi:hypothetical protein CLV59_102635 [Chitinophaga dinghuensis]|uniref:Uncharacterized protein n=1 Tax=Chitinophaga dinghuensis TaxID=1539050 RepID=A0A327W8X2_9BACT|nr:DUF6717 family protein [Chitinophaga dinghuensis]RAJ85928.1 hypothetical protein CLV59_102635 [Chitinophaga dinghuensis]